MPLTENFDILPTNVEYPNFDVYKTPAYAAIYIHHVCVYLLKYEVKICLIESNQP